MAQRPVKLVLQESLLQCFRDYEKHAIPLVSLPPGWVPNGPHQKSKDLSEDKAFDVLRALRSRLATLLGAEEQTCSAYGAWRSLLSSHRGLPTSSSLIWEAFNPVPTLLEPDGFRRDPVSGAPPATATDAAAAAQPPASSGSTAAADPGALNSSPLAPLQAWGHSTSPLASLGGVNRGLEAAAQLLCELHQASREEQLLMEEAPQPDPDACNPQFAQGLLAGHLDACAASVREQAGAGLFAAGPISDSTEAVQPSSRRSSSASGGPGTGQLGAEQQRQQQQQQQQQFLAIQTLLYRALKLKHEPIEWVYDGLAPLMLQEVLYRRKGAPLALALIAACLCTRLGVPATIVRASATPATPQGPTTLSMPAGVPHDVAVRHAGRGAVSGMPTDAWLVAGLMDSVVTETGSVSWRPSGVFLDVSCRGGAVLTADQARQRYGEAEGAAAGAVMPWSEECMWRPEGALAAGCAELARAAMVAHQRRGESDLVVHWLYQLLSLDPRATEWHQMLFACI